jgi:hypothetical protein
MAPVNLSNGRGLFRVVLQWTARIEPTYAGASARPMWTLTMNNSHLNQLLTIQQPQTPDTLTAVTLMQQLVRAAPNMYVTFSIIAVTSELYGHRTEPTRTARSIFPSGSQNRMDIGGGLQAYRGFYQSVRPTIGKLL